jgi:hypothetical protein
VIVHTTPAGLTKAIKAHSKSAKMAIVNASTAAAHRSRAIIVNESPVDQGELKASWKVRNPVLRSTGTGKRFELAVVESTSTHAGIVEAGARPHPVNQEGKEALYQWVRRNFRIAGKGRSRRVSYGGKGQQVRPGMYGSNQKLTAVTNAIVWKLRIKGQKGKFIVRNNMKKFTRIAVQEIDQRMKKALGGK